MGCDAQKVWGCAQELGGFRSASTAISLLAEEAQNTSQSEYLPLADCQGLFSFLACASFLEKEAVWLEAAPGGAVAEARVAEHSRRPQPALPLTAETVRWCGLSVPRAL